MSSRHALARALRAVPLTCVAAALGAVAFVDARAVTFNYDLGSTCTSLTVSGRTLVCNDGTRIAIDPSITPTCPQFALGHTGSAYTLVCAVPNATGLWWREDESGRGTWLSHQGDTIFAVDYAYDAADQPRWRTMIAVKRDDGTFSGDVFESSGPPFSAATFDAQAVTPKSIGQGWLVQDDGNNVRVNMAEGVARGLSRQIFGKLPSCSFGMAADPATAINYTDLWWDPAESGWGVNLAHQGDTIFAAWYTYALDGKPLFLVGTLNKTIPGTYEGDLYRATGPAGTSLKATSVGTAHLDVVNGNNATLTTTVQLTGMTGPITRSRGITRQIFSAPGVACN